MEIDLYRDWIALLKSELIAFGYNEAQFHTATSVVHTHLNLIRRLVRPEPRLVHKARTFLCPPEHAAGLAVVERKIAIGESLTPHLSKLLRNPSFNDSLLNDWGIHHVHLGTSVNSDGFVSRTEPVLFTRFDKSDAYFIEVLPHGSWNMQSLIKTLHENWPESIGRYRLQGAIGLERTISDHDVKVLRKGNVNTMVNLGNGVVYAPIGGGYATSGLSTAVVIQADRCEARLRQMQQAVIDNIDLIAGDAKKNGVAFPLTPQFELRVEGEELYAVETNCMVRARLGKL